MIDNFLKENVKWLLTLVFAAGLTYGEVKDFHNVETRLNKKIKVIGELEKEVRIIADRVLVLETTECE
ncbi:MAG: hypothetical protein KUG81_02650 [Gammaproteobacteria bacterium]|nr:hypothetical protein [Gammaproteobacteria bacterium]